MKRNGAKDCISVRFNKLVRPNKNNSQWDGPTAGRCPYTATVTLTVIATANLQP